MGEGAPGEGKGEGAGSSPALGSLMGYREWVKGSMAFWGFLWTSEWGNDLLLGAFVGEHYETQRRLSPGDTGEGGRRTSQRELMRTKESEGPRKNQMCLGAPAPHFQVDGMEETRKEMTGVMGSGGGMVCRRRGLDSSRRWVWHCPLYPCLKDPVSCEDTAVALT